MKAPPWGQDNHRVIEYNQICSDADVKFFETFKATVSFQF